VFIERTRKLPYLMGVLNVTPDSFSDSGKFFSVDDAVSHGLRMMEDGADFIDVGGESSRPGSEPISADEETRRVMPVIEALVREGAVVSIDTYKPEVAYAAVKGGAKIVNDIMGFQNPLMRDVVVSHQVTAVVMHMQGTPQNMQDNPKYENVVREVKDFLQAQAKLLEQEGIEKENIWIDPGIGFGKTLEHNLLLLRSVHDIATLGYPVLVGVSRKSFIGKLIDEPVPEKRLTGSISAGIYALTHGASILRVHDVREAKQALDVWFALTDFA
jgi:dihydropteroate synthase